MNKQRVKSIIFAGVSFFAFSSCSSHEVLKKDFYKPSQTAEHKIPLSVTIDTDIYIKEINYVLDVGDRYSIDVKDGLINAVQNGLTDIFQNVQTTAQLAGDKAVDFVVLTKYDARANRIPWAAPGFDTTLELIFQDVHRSREIGRYSTQGHVIGTAPASSFLWVSLTVISFGTLLPITIPMNIHSIGKHTASLIEDNISESLNEIVDNIRRDQNRLVLASRGIEISPSTGGGVTMYYPPILKIPPLEGDKVALGVFDLKSIGCGESIGPAVSNTIRQTLFESGHYRVIDRSSMDRILLEQDFQQSGRCDDMECIVRVGKMLAVPKMVAGDVANIGNAYKISLQLVDVESAKVDKIVSESCTCPQEQLFLVAETAAKKLLLP